MQSNIIPERADPPFSGTHNEKSVQNEEFCVSPEQSLLLHLRQDISYEHSDFWKHFISELADHGAS